jgi:hypothetical protein
MDERGRWGAKGKEIQANILTAAAAATSTPADAQDRGAASVARRRGRARCRSPPGHRRRARQAERGERRCEAYLLIGNIFLQRGPGWSYEAALAFDTAADRLAEGGQGVAGRLPGHGRVPENELERQAPWFKKRGDDRAKTLATTLPEQPPAAFAQLEGAKALEREGKFLEARRGIPEGPAERRELPRGAVPRGQLLLLPGAASCASRRRTAKRPVREAGRDRCSRRRRPISTRP